MIAIQNRNLKDLSKKHFEAIKIHLNHPRLKFNYKDVNDWFLNNGDGYSFEDVILADFKQLKLIKEAYTNTQSSEVINYIKNVLFERYFSQSTVGLKSTNYNASELIDNLDIIVCPYCNRNFINNIKYRNGQIRRTSHIDHFFCKDKYPFLAMSFYNLIPCCPSCNHVKSNKSIGYSPYDNKVDSNLNYKFDYEITSTEFLTSLSAFEIRLTSENNEFENNIEILGLRELYGCHKDVVQEILKKKIIYTESKIEELYRNFNELFRDKEEIRNTIFGYYLNEDDFHKRPLSKLATDIYND